VKRMSTVEEVAAARLIAVRNKAHASLREYNLLLQDFHDEDIRSHLSRHSDQIIIDTCKMIFGFQPSLFGGKEEITKKASAALNHSSQLEKEEHHAH